MIKAQFDSEKARVGTSYPAPHDDKCRDRYTWALTNRYKLTQFGVNRVELLPGSWSTQRHWHKTNDEVVIIVSGELVLVTDLGEEILHAGDCVAFKAGDPNPHHLQNRSDQPAIYFDIGGRDFMDVSTFTDIGMEARAQIEMKFCEIKQL